MPERCGANFRKPVQNITDRAKRYRAHSPGCKPKGPKVCFKCGSRRFVTIDHVDGDESNGRKSNLRYACKSHNTILGKRMAKAGKGVRTRQYNPKRGARKSQKSRNPGAANLAQYVQAAVDHTRGAHDEGGRVIHETPKSKRREFAREIAFRKGHRNPAQESAADYGYRKFHGRGPDEHYILDIEGAELQDPYSAHPELFACGQLIRLIVGEGVELSGDEDGDDVEIVEDYGWAEEINFLRSNATVNEYHRRVWQTTKGDKVDQEAVKAVRTWLRSLRVPDVAAVPLQRNDTSKRARLLAQNLYLVGGKQNIDDLLPRLGVDSSKDHCDLGFCYLVEYFTQKGFDRFQPTNYWHHFGEVSGVQPRLMYNQKYKRLYFVGGEYVVKAAGIDN